MKIYLLALALLCETMISKSQTISSLVAAGTGIKWYAAATGGTALSASAPLVNGTVYYASQTINGVEINIQPADMRLFTSCSFIEADIRAERYDALRVCYSPVHLSPTVPPGFRRMSRILCDQ